jgi:hypothetical protein
MESSAMAPDSVTPIGASAIESGTDLPLPDVPLQKPTSRRLRIFAFDPGFVSVLATRGIATATIALPWEDNLQAGPVGNYLEVVDIDHASNRAYAPVDLNRPELLAQDGLPPSEGSPQFHQQMVYAVAMKTIRHFESALGRVAFWADHQETDSEGRRRRRFVRRLRIYPHALREPNAYYSPNRAALLFGYFRALAPGATDVRTGGMVFSCLSHDIVAHETTHALLDGLHPYWHEPGPPDTAAFHEGFADLVALFQHFTMPEALRDAIGKARGDLRISDIMGDLARQFGQATGGSGALRSAVGREGKITDYNDASGRGPHELGAVLVAAVFDGWLQVYEERARAMIRLATGGTGVLKPGDIPQILVDRLAEIAASVANSFLGICIRALDYCPPVEPTLGEYLRAMITADRDLTPDDPHGYRVALVDGFRKRGILPPDVSTWSPDALVWRRPQIDKNPQAFATLNDTLQSMAGNWRFDGDRLKIWRASREDAAKLHATIIALPSLFDELGLAPPPPTANPGQPRQGWQKMPDGKPGEVSGIEVHSVRPARQIGPDGGIQANLVIELTQRWRAGPVSPACRGGCTLIWDRAKRDVRYMIRKRVGPPTALVPNAPTAMAAAETRSDHDSYFGNAVAGSEPFALLHSDR